MYHTFFERLSISSLRFVKLLAFLFIPLLSFAQNGLPATHVDQVTLVVGLPNSPDSPNSCENCLEAEVPLFFQLTQGMSGSYDPGHFRACDMIIKGHVQGDFASLVGKCDVDNISFLAKRAPCGPTDIVAHTFEIDPAFADGQHFIIRQDPSEELFYEESTQPSPFGRLMVRALPGTNYTVVIDEVTAQFNCGNSVQLNESSGFPVTQPAVTNSCSSNGNGPEFRLIETSFDPSTNRYEGNIGVTDQVTASQVSATFKLSPTSGSPGIEAIEILSTTAQSQMIREESGDFYLTLEYSGSVTESQPTEIEVTYPAGTPPNSAGFTFEEVNAVAVTNLGVCCQIDVESSPHPIGTTPPCSNVSRGSLEYGYATFNAQAAGDCGADIQLGWSIDPALTGLFDWWESPLTDIRVIVEGENIAEPILSVPVPAPGSSSCALGSSLIFDAQLSTPSAPGLTAYEITISFNGNSPTTCGVGGPFLDIKVPSLPNETGEITNVLYTSTKASIVENGDPPGFPCPHIATVDITFPLQNVSSFGGIVTYACNPTLPLDGVEICFTPTCPTSPLEYCPSDPSVNNCEATVTTAADGTYDAPTSLLENNYFVTPVCRQPNSPISGVVTTYDLYLIGQHILGVTPLTNWWQIQAADANCNGSISAFDMTVIRRLILGLNPDFSDFGCTSWKFFDDNGDPLNCEKNGCDKPSADILAVKTGNVGGPCSSPLTNTPTPSDLLTEFTQGSSESTLDISIANGPTKPIVAYQFELELSEDIVAVRHPNGAVLDEANYTLTKGGISFAYFAGVDESVISTTTEGEAQLFTLVFAGKTESVTTTLSTNALALCYTADGTEYELGLSAPDQGLARAQSSLFRGTLSAETGDPTLSVFPNPLPRGSELLLTIANAPNARSVQVLDALGRPTVQQDVAMGIEGSATLKVSTNSWIPGIYSIVLLDNSGKVLDSESCVIR